jgi:hypothetical protein
MATSEQTPEVEDGENSEEGGESPEQPPVVEDQDVPEVNIVATPDSPASKLNNVTPPAKPADPEQPTSTENEMEGANTDAEDVEEEAKNLRAKSKVASTVAPPEEAATCTCVGAGDNISEEWIGTPAFGKEQCPESMEKCMKCYKNFTFHEETHTCTCEETEEQKLDKKQGTCGGEVDPLRAQDKKLQDGASSLTLVGFALVMATMF